MVYFFGLVLIVPTAYIGFCTIVKCKKSDMEYQFTTA